MVYWREMGQDTLTIHQQLSIFSEELRLVNSPNKLSQLEYLHQIVKQ